MKRISVNMPEFKWLDVNDKLTFLGSCFSVHIANASREKGFNVLSNPFGVIFNPISLAKLFDDDKKMLSSLIFQSEDKFLSWLGHSEIWSKSKGELLELLVKQQDLLCTSIKNSNTLFITFGTAWVYEHKEHKKIVANCHKQPHEIFDKRCLTDKEIVSNWEPLINKLLTLNPDLKIVFTVSPVRHKKDGLIENNKSKSQLISSVHSLVEGNSSCFYFPSYEFVIDELRDYAYFERDGVHPNRFCIEEIETKFFESFLSSTAKKILKEFETIRQMKNHRPIHPGTISADQFKQQSIKREKLFLDKYPEFEGYL